MLRSVLSRASVGRSAVAKHARFTSSASSWVDVPSTSPFPIQNLPYGVMHRGDGAAGACCVAIGEHVLDLGLLARRGLFSGAAFDASTLEQGALNAFMAQEPQAWAAARGAITELLSAGGGGALRDDGALVAEALLPQSAVRMGLPARIGDYTDFYSSREHATNIGIMFRGVDNALQPNWLHLPVGYHGRASSVVPSGTPIRRPAGQLQVGEEPDSTFGPCKLLDFELEMGFFVGGSPPPLGEAIAMADAERFIFGMVLLNDWSARDIQKWEYVPLGPFGAKNFGTTISPWVVPMAALEPFRCATSAGAQDDPVPLPYLRDPAYGSYDIKLEVAIQGEGHAAPSTVTRSNFANLYWNIKQQLVHHSVTGCNMQPGDLLGSGTISGATEDPPSYGSMLELSWRGAKDVPLGGSGETRKFLKDGDSVSVSGWCEGDGYTVGFGECEGLVLPANKLPVE